jgi:hypothetical protein
MSAITKAVLDELGISKEDLESRIIDELLEHHVRTTDYRYDETFQNKLKDIIDSKITDYIDREVSPRIEERLNTLVLREYTKWGDIRPGVEPKTLTEYLLERIDQYITEDVDEQGLSRSEFNALAKYGPGWTKKGNRINFLISQIIQVNFKEEFTNIIRGVHKNITIGLEEVVRENLKRVSESFTIAVDTAKK